MMILPLIIGNTREALKTVPNSYRQGAIGIGATKWYMIRTILLPSAMSGIVTGIVLFVLGSVIEVGYYKFNLDLVDRRNEAEIGTMFGLTSATKSDAKVCKPKTSYEDAINSFFKANNL